MEYISTRGRAPTLNFEQTTLTGLANDGGLYLPLSWPKLDENQIRQLQGMDYPSLAVRILELFTGASIESAELTRLVNKAYSRFHHEEIAPIKQLDDHLYFMELFHGPTMAFKDFALQVLGQFFQHFLEKNNATCTIVGATSGDTGSAAIAGIRGLDAVNLFMLHPHGRVSEVQRRQMTTVLDQNIYNLSVNGTFDDCQNLVKALFNDLEFRNKHSLSAVNSINWARIAAQVVYYFKAALALGAPDQEVNFSVPTGNFGNVLAGYVARQMGLPIGKLIVGSNRNDILTRFFETGSMEKKGVTPTLSPSMDIQISSNFERYLFELLNHDSEKLMDCMTSFADSGKFSIDKKLLIQAQECFSAYRFDDQQTTEDMKDIYTRTGEVIDPHSIIGVSAAKKEIANFPSTSPTVVLGTAHPAKFPDAVRHAIGVEIELPPHQGNLMSKTEQVIEAESDLLSLKQIINNALTSIES